MTQTFTLKSARAHSVALVTVISSALVLESLVLHQVLKNRYPVVDVLLGLTSVWAIIWIVRDYRAMGAAAIEMSSEQFIGRFGRRLNFSVPRTAVSRIEPPRLMSASGPPKGYLNVTKPAPPNAVIVFAAPVTMRVLGMSRPVSQLAVRVDDPVAFLQAGARP